MQTAFIFHGTEGYPGENWFPWLRGELEKEGVKVFVPQFPTPGGQTLEGWFEVFEEYRDLVSKDSLLIGHSLGGVFALRVLESLDLSIRGAFLVGTPVGVGRVKNWESDQIFVGHPFLWEKIRKNAKRFVVFHSDDDPYVSLENGTELSKKLGVELQFIPGCGHFNAEAGFLKFEKLFEIIEPELL